MSIVLSDDVSWISHYTFDLTTGKLLQDSGLIGESGKIYQSGFPNSYIKFNSGTIEIWAGGVIQAAWS